MGIELKSMAWDKAQGLLASGVEITYALKGWPFWERLKSGDISLYEQHARQHSSDLRSGSVRCGDAAEYFVLTEGGEPA